MELLLPATVSSLDYGAMILATVISVGISFLLTRLTRPLWKKGGWEMPTTARSIATLPLLIGGYAAIMYGILMPAGETHSMYVEKLATAAEEQYDITELTPVARSLPVCGENDREAMAAYTWTDADNENIEGTITKAAEEKGTCKYSLEATE